MPPVLHYPDLGAPPPGWTYARAGSQLRLSPPGSSNAEAGSAAIVISPLVARDADRDQRHGLPAIDRLIEMAIETEEKLGLEVLERRGPNAMRTTTGLVGCSYEVRAQRPPPSPEAAAPALVERRLYVMYSDALCCYGIHYLADETVYETHLKLFLDAARSLKPFSGRVTAPAAAAGPADERSLQSAYRD